MPDMVKAKKNKRKILPYIHYKYLKKPWYTLQEVINMFKIDEQFAKSLPTLPQYRDLFDIYDGAPEISRDNLISLHKDLYHIFSEVHRKNQEERQKKHKMHL